MTIVSTGFPFGIDIDDVEILSGTGAPLGVALTPTGIAINPSVYFDKSNPGDWYIKETAGTGAAAWVKQPSVADITNAINGDSWLDPVLAADFTNYADLTAVETALNIADTWDSITVVATSRILVPDLTAGVIGVYDITGSTGAWTVTLAADSTPNAVDGDVLVVQEGTYADKFIGFNGTIWQETPASIAAILTELTNIRDFVGKTAAGVEAPTYGDVSQVTQGNNLEAAISELSASIGVDVTTDAILTSGDAVMVHLANLSAAIQAGGGTVGTSGPITTVTVVNSQLVDTWQSVEWEIVIHEVATPANIERFNVAAFHNGSAAADAVLSRAVIISNKRIGAKINGLDVDVTLTGAAAAQAMNLVVTSTDAVNVGFRMVDPVPAL